MIENHDIIHISANKNLILSQNDIYFSLHVWKIVFKIHDRNIELLLFAMQNYRKFVFISMLYESLMKEINDIEHRYVTTFDYRKNNIRLQKHWVKIDYCYFVKITNIYYYSFFSLRFIKIRNSLSNHENWIFIKCW